MSTQVFFVINPLSGSGKAKKIWETKLLAVAKQLFPNMQWAYTEKPGHAAILAQKAKQDGFSVVVAAGGDGTLNEVLNGLLDNTFTENNLDNQNHKIPVLSCLALGTGCDFVRTLGFSKDPVLALKELSLGFVKNIDVGLVEYFSLSNFEKKEVKKRYFINIAGCGASGEIVKEINIKKTKWGSNLSYIIATIKTLLKNKTFNVNISYDNETVFSIPLQVLFVCNAQYCGGGMRVSPNSKLTDGLFHIVQIKKINPLRSILLSRKLYSGNYKGLENIIFERTAKSIVVQSNLTKSNSLIPVECDGEMPGYLNAHYSILANKIKILCPNKDLL